MTTLAKHLPALILLAITAAFAGSLAAIGAISGVQALTLFGAALVGVGTLFGVKIGATAVGTSTKSSVPSSPAAPVTSPVAVAPTPVVTAPAPVAPIAAVPPPG